MIDPGKLDRRVVVENYTTANDKYGQSIKTWATYRTRWAAIEYRAGFKLGEKIEAKQLTAINKVYFTLRYESGYTEKMRVSYNLEYFYITSISELGRGTYIEFQTEKRDSRNTT